MSCTRARAERRASLHGRAEANHAHYLALKARVLGRRLCACGCGEWVIVTAAYRCKQFVDKQHAARWRARTTECLARAVAGRKHHALVRTLQGLSRPLVRLGMMGLPKDVREELTALFAEVYRIGYRRGHDAMRQDRRRAMAGQVAA